MHQVQITKVNRPMETVKLATPTGVSERGQQEQAHGSRAQFCSGLRRRHPAACRKEPRAQGSCDLASTIFSLKLQLQLFFLTLILPNAALSKQMPPSKETTAISSPSRN